MKHEITITLPDQDTVIDRVVCRERYDLIAGREGFFDIRIPIPPNASPESILVAKHAIEDCINSLFVPPE